MSIFALLQDASGRPADAVELAARLDAPIARDGGVDPSAVAYDPAANQHDLAAQGWAILHAADGWTPAIASALEPLIARRRAEAGATGRIALEPSPPTTITGALDWLHDVFRAVPIADRPGYVLIVGDLDAVPLAIQQVLATEVYVGRLAFDRADDYRAYAEKLLRAPTAAQADATLFCAPDGSRALELGQRTLLVRGGAALTRLAADRFTTIHPHGDHGTLANGATVGFTVSHGQADAGWSAADRRARQGGLVLGDRLVDAAAGRDGAWLPGGVWLSFACFSAGTPHASVYAPWLNGQAHEVLRHLAPVPFVAATAKALLANPRGPVAFIGHVDLAWAHAFTERAAGRRRMGHLRFIEVIRRLGIDPRVGPWPRGGPGRVGFAQAALRDAVQDFDAALIARRGAADPATWLARMDLDGFILLGDPAAHLAVRDPNATTGLSAVSQAALRQLEPALLARLERVLSTATPAEHAAILRGEGIALMDRLRAALGLTP